jgi:serine/threonine protein kinase
VTLPAPAFHPSEIGPYRILRVLGQGGVGTVYLAQQERPVRRKVALKLIKLGMDTREVLVRFAHERQTLALMSHANIAKMFDAGVTDTGRPYFAMEYVDGLPITDHCDQRQLTVRERLELFATVCRAIQHAHQRGILHRDIKPSNILVTRAEERDIPMVIDFGLAKTIREDASAALLTRHGQIVGTPRYLSPEQVELSPDEVDTRSDVYSLGVVFFELLVGLPPHDRCLSEGGMPRLLMEMQNEETPRPSSRLTSSDSVLELAAKRGTSREGLLDQVRGDLDWIALKAMERDRERRYSTAAELAGDIERYLQHEPIVARPPSTSYRVERFVRRNRVAVITAAAIVLALIVGSAASVLSFLRADSVRQAKDAFVALCESVRSDTATAHIWFEEAIAGDLSIEVKTSVFPRFKSAFGHVARALEGNATAFGDVAMVVDEEVRTGLVPLHLELNKLIAISQERWEKRADEGRIGGDLDQEFDAVFESIQARSADLMHHVEDEAAAGWRRSAQAGVAVNLLAMLLFLGIGWQVVRLTRRRV